MYLDEKITIIVVYLLYSQNRGLKSQVSLILLANFAVELVNYLQIFKR